MPAVVNIAAVANAHEGAVSTPGQLLASRTDDDLSQALTVHYEVSGTATPGVDYQALLGSVEIPAGQVSAPISIQPIDDQIPEFPEDVIVSLLADPSYQLGADSQAVVKISNQETITVTAGTNLTFTIGYTVPTTTELPVLTAEVLPIGASFSIVHSEAHAPGAHTVGEFSWTPLLEQVGSHEVVFRVTVPGTDIDEISSLFIDVIPPAVGPTIDLGGSTDFEDDGQAQLFTWNVSDANGLGPVNVNVTKDGSEIFASTDFSGSFNFDADGPGNYALTVTASNLLGETAQATRTVEVVDDDPAPPSIFLGGSFGNETEDQAQFFTWDVSDDSGLSAFSVTVTRDLGNGPVEIFRTTDAAQSSGSFNFDEFRAGTYQIAISARDADGDWTGDDLSAVASQTVVVTTTTSTPPVLGNGQRFGIFEGEELVLFVEGGTFLPEVPGLTASGLPAGATFSLTEQTVGYAAGQFHWTPGFDQAGTHQVNFTISDSQGSDSITIFIDVIDVPPPPDTQPPSIALDGSASAENDGQTQQFTWNASDVGGLSSVSVSITQDGNEIFASTDANGSYYFDSQGLGNFTIEVTATDSASLTSTASRSVTVSDDDTEPPLIVLGGSSGAENDGQSQQFTWIASDASGLASISVTVTQDGNEIFTSTEASGTFNFDAYGLGTFVLSATATDADNDWTGDSLTANINSSVTVSDDDPQAPVIVLGGSSGSESEAQLQEFTWDVSDDSGLSSLEVVITQNTGSGPVEIFRTEDVADAVGSFNFDSYGVGTFEIAVTAVDGDDDWSGDGSANSAMETVTVTTGNSPPVLTVPGPFTVDEGQTLTFQVFAYDPEGDSVAFVAPGLPDGARFDPATLSYDPITRQYAQTFTWAPRATQAGTYSFTFKVRDNGAGVSTATVAVTVNDVPVHEQIPPLADQVEALTELNRGQRNSLLVKLRTAQTSLERGREQTAEALLQALVNQIGGLLQRPALSEATKDELRDVEAAIAEMIVVLQAPAQPPQFRADLDVNGDGDLEDAVDGVANYIPGYEGATPKISTGTTFNAPNFEGQRMRIVIEGAGTAAGVTAVTFILTDYSFLSGYAENVTDPAITGRTKDVDFSFQANRNAFFAIVTQGTTEQEGGKIEANRTYVDIWCKDYAGTASVAIRVFSNGRELHRSTLDIPVDADQDGIADKWELEKVTEWENQYWVNANPRGRKIDFFSPAEDTEKLDPDSPDYDSKKDTDGGINMPAHKTAGDALTVFQEYRGFILDGGGHDGDGANPHGGGHLRLSPALKEFLVEADAVAFQQGNTPGIVTRPTGGFTAVLNAVSQGFSDSKTGAGIRMYWVLNDTNLANPTPPNVTQFYDDARQQRHVLLRSSFVHLLFAADSDLPLSRNPEPTGAFTMDRAQTAGNGTRQHNGSFVLVDRLKRYTDSKQYPFDNALISATAHELTHMLINPPPDPLDKKPVPQWRFGEHENDSNEDGIMDNAGDYFSLMSGWLDAERSSAIKFSNPTRREIDLRENPGIG